MRLTRKIGTTLDKRLSDNRPPQRFIRKGKSAHAIRSKTPQHHGLWASLTHRLLDGRPRPHRLPRPRPTAQPSPVSSPSGKPSAISGAHAASSIPATIPTRSGPRLSQLCWSRRSSHHPGTRNVSPGVSTASSMPKNAAQHYLWWLPTRKQNTEIRSKLRSIESPLTVCDSWF